MTAAAGPARGENFRNRGGDATLRLRRMALDPPVRRRALALALYVVVTIAFALTAAPETLAAHTPYNHFALLAEDWLHGRLDRGGPPPAYAGNNDFASFEGRTFVTFPPFPALLLVPAVALAGSAEAVRDGRFFLALGGVGPAILFLALERAARLGISRRTEAENVGLALLLALGTVYWPSAVQGTTWFAAHVVGVALAALYLHASLGAERPVVAGLALGLGFATRTPLLFAAPLFLAELVRTSLPPGTGLAARVAGMDPRRFAGRLARFLGPLLVVGAVLGALNVLRFHDPFEFGHRYLAIGWRPRIERWGLFSLHYLARNLSVALAALPFSGTADAPFRVNVHGLALWFTSPFLLWAAFARRPPPRGAATFRALAIAAAAVAVPNLLYQNTGWIQFGWRFSNDFAVFLVALLAIGVRRATAPFVAAAGFALAVNAFGAVTFQRERYERFYFLDPTQRVLLEPD